MAFQVICNEIIEKKIQHDNVFAYTAMRLRQFGHDLSTIKKVSKKKKLILIKYFEYRKNRNDEKMKHKINYFCFLK